MHPESSDFAASLAEMQSRSKVKGGAYPAHARLLWKVISLQLFAAEPCNKFLKIEHHDSIV